MIDTHSHLFDKAFDDLEDCIIRCKNKNINKIVLVGFSLITNIKALEYSKKYSIFAPTVGLHPSEASIENIPNINKLEETIKNNKVYAIGECGLDYYWVKDNKEIQKELFEEQIKLSIKYDLPIIIHCRDAILDTYELLLKYKGKIKGVMHCYSGSYEMALKFIELGLYISLGGPVTFKNAKVPKEVALKIDLNNLLIETDCPYLAPTPHRGERNESSYVSYICEEIANIKQIDKEIVERITDNNAKKLFRL